MNIDKIYKLKSHFASKATGNEMVIVPLSGHVSKMNQLFTLNETGRFIWEKIEENATPESIAQAMMQEFDVNADLAKKDVEDFIRRLSSFINQIEFER